MASGPTHLMVGAAAGISVAILDREAPQGAAHNAIVAGGIGAFFGKLPDLIEPSLNNPHHRQFFHSVVVFGAVASGLKKAYEWEPEDDLDKLLRGLSLIGGSAYLSHLVLDACTKRSLPIFGKL